MEITDLTMRYGGRAVVDGLNLAAPGGAALLHTFLRPDYARLLRADV